MDALGLNSFQAPARADLRQGASTVGLSQGASAPAIEQGVARAVQAVSEPAESKGAKALGQQDKQETPEDSALPESAPDTKPVNPEKVPADLSAAEKSAAYAQLLGKDASGAADAAKRLFLEAQNLFKVEQ